MPSGPCRGRQRRGVLRGSALSPEGRHCHQRVGSVHRGPAASRIVRGPSRSASMDVVFPGRTWCSWEGRGEAGKDVAASSEGPQHF